MAIRSETLAAIPLCLVVGLGTRFELFLVASVALYRGWNEVRELTGIHIETALISRILQFGVVMFSALQVIRSVVTLSYTTPNTADFPAKPLFFPCETSHKRLFPQKNAFKYSYLLTGIPVGWKGTSGGMISADVDKDGRPWYLRMLSLKPSGSWWSVHGDNYMGRGSVEDGLRGKLDQYLREENFDPKDYPYAYLFTAAKFLGYSSNPLSIWNLYSESKELRAMIYEVNNTFGESHRYLLVPDGTDVQDTTEADTTIHFKAPRHRVKFSKELFVSPFNDRNECYSAIAADCLYPKMKGTGPFDATITLSSPEGRAKVIARVYSTGKAVDPLTLSLLEKIHFLYSWWGIGFLTMPRTLWQAYILKGRLKLAFSFAPEPKEKNVERTAMEYEVRLERVLVGYLRHVISQSQIPIRIRYTPAGLHDAEDTVLYSPTALRILWDAPDRYNDIKQLEIKVLSPTFYSRLLNYGFCSMGHILLSESQLLNLTIKLSDTQLVSSLFGIGCPQRRTSIDSRWELLPWYERLAVTGLSSLTDPTKPASYLPNGEQTTTDQEATNRQLHHAHHIKAVQIEDTPISLLGFLATAHPTLRHSFLPNAVKLASTPYTAFGIAPLLDLEIFFLRCIGAWVAVGFLL